MRRMGVELRKTAFLQDAKTQENDAAKTHIYKAYKAGGEIKYKELEILIIWDL